MAISPAASEGLAAELREIVGGDHVRSPEGTDAVGRYLPRMVVEPGDEREVATVLACANNAGAAVTPRGGGTKMRWGNMPTRADVVLSLARLDHVIEHAWADLTVTVEAGCPISKLQTVLAEHGQRLALDTLWPDRATVGGVLSTNESGALRLRFGGLRDLVIGITLALPDGTLARSGGKVVKNVAGYDLPKLATSALGTLGVITQATFRLHPVPRNARTLSFTAADAARLMLAVQDSQLAHSALQIRADGRGSFAVDVLIEGTEAGIMGQAATARELAGVEPRDEEAAVWEARSALWSDWSAIAKVSLLPSDVGWMLDTVGRKAEAWDARWQAVVYGHGIGWLNVDGPADGVPPVVLELRAALAARGGSLVVLHQHVSSIPIETWGETGDALPLMRAVKQQLDPAGILNPGRFVGGI